MPIDHQLEPRLRADPGKRLKRIPRTADPAERRHIRHDAMPQLPRNEVTISIGTRLRRRLRTRREDHTIRLHHRIHALNQEISIVNPLHALHLCVIVYLHRQPVKLLPERIHDRTRLIRIRIDIAPAKTRLHPDHTEPVQYRLRSQHIQR